MKHFFANLIVLFIPFPKLRRRIRNKIMGIKQTDTQNKIEEQEGHDYPHLKSEWLKHNKGNILIPGRFNEYDLIFCIGATCHGTTMLKRFELRRFSTPFDYTAGAYPNNWFNTPDIHRDSRFYEKISAICNGFKDWLNPQYFKYISHFIAATDVHHMVVNTKTNIQYIHEFPIDKDIMQHMPEFISKMQRRINNLYDAINKSDKILIVWVSRIWDQTTVLDKNVPDEDIKWAVKQLQRLYPNKNFDFVFFEHDGTKQRFEYDKQKIATGAFKIISNHFLNDPEYNFTHNKLLGWGGHVHVISEMLDNIHLSENAFSLPYKPSDDPF